jgi:hypothetical protein
MEGGDEAPGPPVPCAVPRPRRPAEALATQPSTAKESGSSEPKRAKTGHDDVAGAGHSTLECATPQRGKDNLVLIDALRDATPAPARAMLHLRTYVTYGIECVSYVSASFLGGASGASQF